MTTVTLMHLSDLHVADRNAYPFWRTPRTTPCDTNVLGKVALFARQVGSVIDGILITGDIADSGITQDLLLARCFVAGSVGTWSMRRLIDYENLLESGANVYVMPGNHDRFKSPTRRHPDPVDRFGQHFKAHWGEDRRVKSYRIPDTNPRLCVIAADFSLRRTKHCLGKGGYAGQGMVYDDILEELVESTVHEQRSRQPLPVVWCTHFAPGFPDCDQVLRLIDDTDLLSRAVSADVRYIVCGHMHRRLTYRQQGVTILCGGTAGCNSVVDETTIQFLRFEVEADKVTNVMQTHFEWDKQQRDFVECTPRFLLP